MIGEASDHPRHDQGPVVHRGFRVSEAVDRVDHVLDDRTDPQMAPTQNLIQAPRAKLYAAGIHGFGDSVGVERHHVAGL